MGKRIITRAVLILSLVSLFTDISSEMLYPVMPMFLKSIGFSVLLIGVLEGIAEATAGISKGYFGQLSDKTGKRVPFIRFGYMLSALSKPLMVVFAYPLWIFFARTADRLGKGIRTGARDAFLSDETTPEHKAKVFGFHRALDTFGAFLGPLLALIFLYFYPEHYKALFIIAFIPGIASILITFLIKDKKKEPVNINKKVGFLTFLKYLKHSGTDYKKLIIGLLAFTLFNSSDIFLLLMMKNAGLDDISLIGVYIFYNLVYAVFSYPMGMIGDKIGLKKTFIFGLCLFALVYLGIAVFNNLYVFYFLFFIYGIYAASTESISKAWITNICKKEESATAIGAYTALNSVFTMIASSFAGLVWFLFGAKITFLITGFAVIIIILYFSTIIKYQLHKN
jgi:MFS family permease